MFVLDRLRSTANWTIRVPIYHRGHLSLYPGTTVYLAPVVRAENRNRNLPEVLGTTIQQSSWSAVYRVSITLHDAAGVLHKTLASIARHGGNVLNLDSTSTDQEIYHHVELVVDFASLINSNNNRSDLSMEIEGLLLADCSQHVVEDPLRGFEIRVRPLTSLRRLNDSLLKLRTNRYPSPVQEVEVAQDGHITLDEPITKILTGSYFEEMKVEPPLTYVVSSDTAERIFRVTFVPDQSQVVWCAVKHYDRPGALSAIADKIQRGGITVLSALNRVQRHHGRSWFEVILAKDSWSTPISTLERTEEVRSLLEDVDLKYDFLPKVYFNRSEADAAMKESEGDEVPAHFWTLNRFPISDWLAEKESELALTHKDSERLNESRENRTISSKRALSIGTSMVRQSTGRIRPMIFISMEFTAANQSRLEIARNCIEKRHLTLDVVDGADKQATIRDEVLLRVAQATHFIGIWAPSPKDSKSKRCSPWLQWELGLASALRKPYGILVQRGTNPIDFEKIHGERFYFPFSEDDKESFRQALENCLSLLFPTEY